MELRKEHTTPRDVFMYLLMIGTLYTSIISFLTLLFQYINIGLPDPLGGSITSALEALRAASATLVVVFPVFVFISYLLERENNLAPERREIRIRKWFIYFTLFAAAVTIIVQLARLVYAFYSGDLSAQFGLKILAVLTVAAGVFGYYFWDLMKRSGASKAPRAATIIASGVIGISLISGVFVAGTPQTQRALRFDEQRVNDLAAIQSQVMFHWNQKGKLPASLDVLKDDISGFRTPQDPGSGAAYEYTAINPTTFELCATFSHPSRNDMGVTRPEYLYPYNDTWAHEAGRACFRRTIDPELYKPQPEPTLKP